MRRFTAATVCLLSLALVTGATATIKPGRGMSGVKLGMTARQVQAKLGRPVAKGSWKWFYSRVTVTFRNRRVVELMTTRSGERFANGLGVDSSEAEVRTAFPHDAVCSLVARSTLQARHPRPEVASDRLHHRDEGQRDLRDDLAAALS